jgi:hypothetical protein
MSRRVYPGGEQLTSRRVYPGGPAATTSDKPDREPARETPANRGEKNVSGEVFAGRMARARRGQNGVAPAARNYSIYFPRSV